MQEDHASQRRFRFGSFELDARAAELRKQGRRIGVQEQPLQVLTVLLEHAGEVVTREELRKALWPADTFVDFDHGLNKAINKLREALGDSAESPRFVETVPRRGYRFLADVTVDDAVPVAQTVAHRLPSRAFKILAFVLFLAIAALAAWKISAWTHPTPVIRSLAVLPLESLSSDASQDYFADGMTDELISDLAHISALRVISRTSVIGYKHAHKPLPQIARELNVDAVVEGTVLRAGDRVRISAQLIEASTDRHLWSKTYEGDLRDTLALQSGVARAVADEIQINLSSREQAALKSIPLVNPDAYESYLKGRYFWNKRTASGLQTALAYFNQSIQQDPKFARAYAGLADTYSLLGDWQYAVMSSREALPKAKAAAVQALGLDSTLGEAHNSLAFCLDGFDWDFDAAGKEFLRAIELNSGYATAHHWYAWHLGLLARYDEAIAEMKKAASVDPLSLIISSDLAELLLIAHSYDASILQSRKTIEMDPDFGLAHNQLGQAYLEQHLNEQAVAELQRAVQLSGASPTCLTNLARAYAASGRKREALALLDDLKKRANPSYSYAPEIAMIYASFGESDQAMRWLQQGFDERFNPGVLLRPGFGPLRSDPRFQDLVRRVGLPH